MILILENGQKYFKFQNSQIIKNKTGGHIRKLSWQKCDVIYEQNNVRASLIG